MRFYSVSSIEMTHYSGTILLLLTLGFILIMVGASIFISELVTYDSAEVDLIAATGLVLIGCMTAGVGLLAHRETNTARQK